MFSLPDKSDPVKPFEEKSGWHEDPVTGALHHNSDLLPLESSQVVIKGQCHFFRET